LGKYPTFQLLIKIYCRKFKAVRERPINLKGVGVGYVFLFKNILIPNVAEQNILILVEEKKII
jgi:hypothetical protein